MKNAKAHIQVLPDNVINKIAAGEVVERPAAVVKELMENALDAGATDLKIEIVAGGRTLIAVADNGGGMGRNDALLSIERHATSKISDVNDIERVSTLGFRGEALAAIASVSRFTLRTRPPAELAGTELILAGGRMQEVRDVGCAPGTLVEVRHLFFNVPARRKFLRSDQTELAHIRLAFMMYALAYPSVGMQLKADGRELYNLPAQASLPDRLGDLFASIPNQELRRVAYAAGPLKISGYIALPSLTRADRSEQHLFINQRPTAAALLSGAIREGYKMLIPKDRYPVVFLFLDLDPGQIDVNVHPAKKEVRFRNPAEVRQAVAEAIRQTLARRPGQSNPAYIAGSAAVKAPAPDQPATGPIWSYPARRPSTAPLPQPTDKTPAAPAAGMENKPWAWRRIVGQIGSLYVVMETEDGLVLMDPHAAHERVLFEKFMAEISGGRVKSQALLMAETVVLPPVAAVALQPIMAELKQTGFNIAEFGQDTFLIDAVPACFGNVAASGLIKEIAAALNESAERNKGGRWLEELIAQAACRAAVKAHTRLAAAELEELVAQLEKAEMPYTCPHGRPIIIHFSFQELAKKFGRNAPRD